MFTCCMDLTNDVNRMFNKWFCWLLRERNEIIWRFVRLSRAGGPYNFLRTRNWPITAHEINQPYNNSTLCIPNNSFGVKYVMFCVNENPAWYHIGNVELGFWEGFTPNILKVTKFLATPPPKQQQQQQNFQSLLIRFLSFFFTGAKTAGRCWNIVLFVCRRR